MLKLFQNGFKDLLLLRQAFRVAIGLTITTLIGIIPSFTSGCLISILFLVAIMAGTTEPYVGFQLQSADLMLLGAVLAFTGVALVRVVANVNHLAAVFTAAPFLLFFASLRCEEKLMPLPTVASSMFGLQLIAQFSRGR